MRTRVASPTVLAAERHREAGAQALRLLSILVNRAVIEKDNAGLSHIWTTFPDLARYGQCCACIAKADEAENVVGSARVKLVKA